MKPDFEVAWRSPSNIALVKYWGKHGVQLPNNASLSMTLKNAHTVTSFKAYHLQSGLQVKYLFEKKHHPEFESRIKLYLESLLKEMPFLEEYAFEISSENSFPHSTGIASSASSMSALALCLVSFENVFLNKNFYVDFFAERASQIARLGSGSASRSIYGMWSTWGEIDGFPETSDRYASPIGIKPAPMFQKMGDAVLIVSSAPKKVSSTMGHSLMNVHPFSKARYEQANENLQALLFAMQVGDFETFASIVENEALTLHSLLMTSSDDGLLLKPGSLQIIDAIRKFRSQTNVKLCFTLDAGPNVHLLYPESEKQKVHGFIHDELLQFCENRTWINDGIGDGSQQISTKNL
ncbi:MAG: diphosphomevalonate decarboxylase [Prolixibacteraceae bacterium]|jgi:diphosphomevalonate decarboxylase|nr:diphosphomevalonate decarboxylase [Prolixibacteraceae bacterium]